MVDPSRREPQMDAFQDTMALAMFGRKRTDSIKANLCVACGKPATHFRDTLSQVEYPISGFCQACQDKAFTPPDGGLER